MTRGVPTYHIEVDVPSQTLIVHDPRGMEVMRFRGRDRAQRRSGNGWAASRRRVANIIFAPRSAPASRPTRFLFRAGRPGETYSPALRIAFPGRDWILTRILWLCGLERGKNRLGKVDTMRRYIYIHGCPDDDPMGSPGSRGCVKMRNGDIIRLFDRVPVGTRVTIRG